MVAMYTLSLSLMDSYIHKNNKSWNTLFQNQKIVIYSLIKCHDIQYGIILAGNYFTTFSILPIFITKALEYMDCMHCYEFFSDESLFM